MSNFQQRRPAFVPDVFTDDKLRLYGKPVQEGAFSPTLHIRKKGNYPTLSVNTGLRKNDRQVKIETAMSPVVLRSLCQLIIEVARSKIALSYTIENWDHVWKRDFNTGKSSRSESPVVVSRTTIMKTEQGNVILNVSTNNDSYDFNFGQERYHKIHRDGNMLSEAEAGARYAIDWANLVMDVYLDRFIHGWEEPEYKRKAREERIARATGGNGGGNSNGRFGGNGGGGYNNQQNSNVSQNSQNVDSSSDDWDIQF